MINKNKNFLNLELKLKLNNFFKILLLESIFEKNEKIKLINKNIKNFLFLKYNRILYSFKIFFSSEKNFIILIFNIILIFLLLYVIKFIMYKKIFFYVSSQFLLKYENNIPNKIKKDFINIYSKKKIDNLKFIFKNIYNYFLNFIVYIILLFYEIQIL